MLKNNDRYLRKGGEKANAVKKINTNFSAISCVGCSFKKLVIKKLKSKVLQYLAFFYLRKFSNQCC